MLQASYKGRDTDLHELKQEGLILYSNKSIGEGSYSKVKRGFSRRLQKDVAVKIINRELSPKDYREKFLPRELLILRQIKHEFIVTYYGVFDLGSKVFILMDYFPKGDLLEYVQSKKFVPEGIAKPMFSKILSAVQYLHFNGIIHRDLKCENILLDANLSPKLTDFGFSKMVTGEVKSLSKTFCGSAAYASPEVLKGIPYDGELSDVWSLGVVLYIMVTGLMPFDDSDTGKLLRQLKMGPKFATSRQNLSERARELITKILIYCPRSRPTIAEIASSSWVMDESV